MRFAHAETMLPVVALLGLYRDEGGLYANATYEQIVQRAFRASVISPFSANLYMVLYECDGGASTRLVL